MSGSPSWMARHVSNEPRGRADVGLVRTERTSGDVAAMTAVLESAVARPVSELLAVVATINSTCVGRSSINLSMEQSWIMQVVGVLLQVSLKRCCPSFAEEW